MSSPREAFEVIIIGGGIAGNALAAVLARAGKAVLVLERSTVYRDRVRGEGSSRGAWPRRADLASTRR
jgi:flavin-dependent dehydrogenase